MQLVRTTLRLDAHLKKAAEKLAWEKDTTLQKLFNQALAHYLEQISKKTARKIVFKTHNLGTSLDHLTRADYY